MTSTFDFTIVEVGKEFTLSSTYFPSAGYTSKLKYKDCLDLVDKWREVTPIPGGEVRDVYTFRACETGYRLVVITTYREFDLENSIVVANHLIKVVAPPVPPPV